MQFRSINQTTNDGYYMEAQQKYYHVNYNIMQTMLGLGYFIKPEKRH